MNLVAKGFKEGKYFKNEKVIFLNILWFIQQWLLQNVWSYNTLRNRQLIIFSYQKDFRKDMVDVIGMIIK